MERRNDEVESLNWESSQIKSTDYRYDEEALVITFDNGEVYKYSGVDKRIYMFFKHSASKGRFFHENIRDEYKFEKL